MNRAARGANVAVVTVNYRNPDLTSRCLAALRAEKERLPDLRVIVVEGGSDDGSAAVLGKTVDRAQYRDWMTFLPLTVNGGFGWANNQAILTLAGSEAPPEYIHLLNPDTEVVAGAVAALARELDAHPRCAAAGSQLLTQQGERAASAFRFPSPGRELVSAARSEVLRRMLGIRSTVIDASQSQDVDWVSGASVMFRTAALRETGLFDDGFFMYYEEVELMQRLHRAGWTIRFVAESRVVHVEGGSTGVSAATVAKPLPKYWYQSRRRYFALVNGRSGLWFANICWAAGFAFASLKKLFGRRGSGSGARLKDMLQCGLWPKAKDCRKSVPALGDPPGKPPAWLIDQ